MDENGGIRQGELLRRLRHDSSYTDATIVVQGSETAVHRAVLAQLSPFFTRLFERNPSSRGTPRITLQYASAKSVEILVDYAYGLDVFGSLKRDMDVALETANLAATLSVHPLSKLAARAARTAATSKNRSMVFYALKLCGAAEEAQAVLDDLSKDAQSWRRNEQAVARLSVAHLAEAMQNRNLVASEDDLLETVLTWIRVDPAQRAIPGATTLVPLLRPQRLQRRSAALIADASGILPSTLGYLIATDILQRGMCVPSCPLPRSRRSAFLGAKPTWMTSEGMRSIFNEFGNYGFAIVMSRRFEFEVNLGTHEMFYFDFSSLCMKIELCVSSRGGEMELSIERRNRDVKMQTLDDALAETVIICETALVSPIGAPLENAYALWSASALVLRRQPAEGGESPMKRTKMETEGRMEIARNDVCVKLADNLDVRENGLLRVALCLKAAKKSALRECGYL